MITIEIPGYKILNIKNIVMDYNGTLALDGYLLPGVQDRLLQLSRLVSLCVITADTFGKVLEQMADLPVKINVLKEQQQAEQKLNFIRQIGSKKTAAIGNGQNDALMLKEAELGIAVIENEGAAMQTLNSADVVVTNINNALDLFINSGRLIATLRK